MSDFINSLIEDWGIAALLAVMACWELYYFFRAGFEKPVSLERRRRWLTEFA
jgi:hypothetical protein